MKIRKILVPIDYSGESERALRLACAIADELGASIDLLHVYQIPSDIYPYTLFITGAIKEQIAERENERIEAWCEKAGAAGVMATGHAIRGETHDEIPALARDLGSDLIVMGTRGRSGIQRAFLGSTAERTIQLAPCPVISTRNGSDL